jgi:hypothetical protein
VAARHLGPIDVERIFLYEENPRHEPIESEPEIIEHLCKDEQVFNLARSIADAGPNPLALVGIVQTSEGAASKTYQSWEGNRRVCAIKLLNDPDLAPPNLRKDFHRLASESSHVPIKKINCVVFDDHDDLRFWMGIIHNGTQDGVGLSAWDAQQKARHFGTNRNRVALAVLDAAQTLNLISKEDRVGTITTVQRFVNRSIVREALGIDASNPDDVTFNRPLPDFKKQLGRFIDDLIEGRKVSSRHNQNQADSYGRKLAASTDISNERTEPQSLKTIAAARTPRVQRRAQPKQPRKLTTLTWDKTLGNAIEETRSNKLESLYYSICSVRLEHNVPLLAVGVWAFVESLCALAGKNADTDFVSFYSNQRLTELGAGGKLASTIRSALSRININGNATKHHEIAASFDGEQLNNDLATITPLLIKTIQPPSAKK